MNNSSRDEIKRMLMSYLEIDFRRCCKIDKIPVSKTENLIEKAYRENTFALKAEEILSKYEHDYLNNLTNEITTQFFEKQNNETKYLKDFIENRYSIFNDMLAKIDDGFQKFITQIKSEEIENINNEIQIITVELDLLKNLKETLNKTSERKSKKVGWYFAIGNIIIFTSWSMLIYRLTWDKMELWTYLFGGLFVIINSIYLVTSKTNFSQGEIAAKLETRYKNHLYGLYRFSEEYLKTHEQRLQDLHAELVNIKKSYTSKVD